MTLNLVNLRSGDKAKFVVEFVDSSGNLSLPGGGTLKVTYALNGTSFTDTLALIQNQSFFTVTWGSSSSDQGLCPWSIFAPGNVLATTGFLRIIN
jgi:hypothetical protein